MHPCRFPLGLSKLDKNNDFEVKPKNFGFTFQLDNNTFKSVNDTDKSKYRISLRHKKTGDVKYFYTNWLNFKPELKKLIPSEQAKSIGVSKSELLHEFGTGRDQRQLKDLEKQQVNAVAQKAVRVAQFEATKTEKDDAEKGNKLDTSYMEVDEKQMRLSTIAPEEVLAALATKTELDVSHRSVRWLVSERLPEGGDSDSVKRKKMVQLCMLLDYMVTFYLLPVRQMRTKTVIDYCPPVVIKHLLTHYTLSVSSDNSKSQIQVPKEEKDKLFSMILALYCHLGHYKFPLNLLQLDLKSSTDRLKKHLQLFNVKVTKAPKVEGEESTSNNFLASTTTPFVLDSE